MAFFFFKARKVSWVLLITYFLEAGALQYHLHINTVDLLFIIF